MNRPDLELLCLLDELRPKNYQASLIKPDGTQINSVRFHTHDEACEWIRANADLAHDVTVIYFVNREARN